MKKLILFSIVFILANNIPVNANVYKNANGHEQRKGTVLTVNEAGSNGTLFDITTGSVVEFVNPANIKIEVGAGVELILILRPTEISFQKAIIITRSGPGDSTDPLGNDPR